MCVCVCVCVYVCVCVHVCVCCESADEFKSENMLRVAFRRSFSSAPVVDPPNRSWVHYAKNGNGSLAKPFSPPTFNTPASGPSLNPPAVRPPMPSQPPPNDFHATVAGSASITLKPFLPGPLNPDDSFYKIFENNREWVKRKTQNDRTLHPIHPRPNPSPYGTLLYLLFG